MENASDKSSACSQTIPSATSDIAPPSPADFPIVGVGASAGGLEAFTQLLGRIPQKTGMAFVLVQHLDPTHESQLTELLAKATVVPVTAIVNGLQVCPDHIYVIPPNTNVTITSGHLQLAPRGDTPGPNLPLDVFFRSLAEDQQSGAIGVILSGTGSDGSLGLAEIKAVGGTTFAQDEKSAKFPEMPQNAVSSGCIDFVLPPEQIAVELTRIGQHPYLQSSQETPPNAEAQHAFETILNRLRAATGVDFGHYRETTLHRRIARRMALHHHDTLAEYIHYLDENPTEIDVLYRDILINVTSFFRDSAVFDVLKAKIFPEIFKNKSPTTPIRVWVPGCSTGQEVYSLAMILLEYMDQSAVRPPMQIFGTDINDAVAIEKARQGLYPATIEAEVSEARLQRFFTKEIGGYRISKSIRDICVFARQNVVADPPFSRLDLVSCRNVLIYLSATLQKRIIPTFHYSLNAGGYLLLGTAETVGRFSDLFNVVDQKHSLFIKAPLLARTYPYFAADDYKARAVATANPVVERTASVADVQREADRVVLGRYAPAGVLINENLEILQFRGRTGPYIEPAPGEASYHLLRMARQSLFVELRSAIDESKAKNITIRRQNVHLRDDEGSRTINLEVLPIRALGAGQRCFLVLFEEAPITGETSAAPRTQLTPAEEQSELNTLRQELASTREYLQAIIEQQSAANEELKSANEEVLSSNEELQSTNEEMQTAKEELQSTNEELRTVNDELQSRSHEVSQLNDDLANTLASIKIPIVMFSTDLRIRRFTPIAGEVLHLSPGDLGRPLRDVTINLKMTDLKKSLRDVIASASPQEREVQDRTDHWYLMRLHPYRTTDSHINGVVLVLLDIHTTKLAEALLHDAKNAADTANRAKDRFLAVLSHELRNPLTPILTTASMLLQNPAYDADLRAELAMIHRNAVLEARLIDDLLDITRITHGKIELNKRPVDLHEVIRRALEVCKPDMDARKMKFTIDASGGPILILADPDRLQQVFWNLLRNATKFTPLGGSVDVDCHDDGAGNAMVEVSDNGMGMEPAVLTRIFNAFEQTERSITQRFGGLGLGLTISKSIVELHGGTIDAHSAGQNQGSTFRVRLPLLAKVASAISITPPVEPNKPLRHLRILLVEDHGDTSRTMNRLLSGQGHDVRRAADVATALHLAGSRTFDLILSDLGLPDGSGLDLLRALNARGIKLPAIALSGYGLEQDVQLSREAGFAAHLTKPIDIHILESTIQRVLT